MNDLIKFRFGYQNGVYVRNSNIVKKKDQCIVTLSKQRIKSKIKEKNLMINN